MERASQVATVGGGLSEVALKSDKSKKKNVAAINTPGGTALRGPLPRRGYPGNEGRLSLPTRLTVYEADRGPKVGGVGAGGGCWGKEGLS